MEMTEVERSLLKINLLSLFAKFLLIIAKNRMHTSISHLIHARSHGRECLPNDIGQTFLLLIAKNMNAYQLPLVNRLLVAMGEKQ